MIPLIQLKPAPGRREEKAMSKVAAQRGEIRLGTILTLAVVAFVVYEGFKFAPVLFAQYEFKDAVVEEAKFSAGKTVASITRRLVEKARALDLPIDASQIKVNLRGTSCRVEVQYRLTVEWLPGKPYSWDVNEVSESVIF